MPGGIGWYRKTIDVPKNWKNKHIEIAFDGVFRNSTVWANGIKLGFRPYGYLSFAYDISKIANESETITFSVRVDNEKQSAARWYTGSGIYADIWIDIKEKIYVPRHGIFVRTEGNKVSIDTDIRNEMNKSVKAKLLTTIRDAENHIVATSEKQVKVDKQGSIKQELEI